MSSQSSSKCLNAGDGEIIMLLGEPRVLKMTPAETAGACLQFETSHAPGTQVPLHLHREEHEAFYLLVGECEFEVENSRFTATAGAFVFVPSGAVHGLGSLVRIPRACS
jgi:quercetin dioxygenase-like cupin family protein